MTKASDNLFPGIIIRESANDGSDFSNPSADYRRLFLGEDGQLHLKDSAGAVTDVDSGAGSVATDAIWDAAGDLVQGTGANTAAKLTLGAAGTVVRSTGSTNAYAFPPGYEMAYAEFSSPVSVTQTVEASADTVVTAGAFTADGSSAYLIEFVPAYVNADNAGAGRSIKFWLFEDGSSIGSLGLHMAETATNNFSDFQGSRRMVPASGSRTYSIRATVSAGTGSVGAGAGGAGNYMPGYIRITKAT